MPEFVVERYIPGLQLEGVRAQAQREQAVAAAGEGLDVRHLRTTYLRDDELCFSLFDAPSHAALCEANERAAMPFERIVEAIDVGAEEVLPIQGGDR